ncbi:MAG: AAA family ATPase [Paludibacteraceae bacterium]|nr:AAA family ATPase [Paludibacteraceae bacterium]
MKRYKTGFVLGKFCPLHKGHMFLIDTALSHVEQLYIVVDNIMDDVIAVNKRIQWVKKEYPETIVLTQSHPLPQDPSETPEFWNIWRETLCALLPERIDVVFASETYGERLAKELNAEFFMVDYERQQVPISATSIRADIVRNWEYLSDSAKADLMTTICIFGPESTGKSTLTKQLATYFGSPYVDEYAETVIRSKNGDISFEDMEIIVRGHHENIQNAMAVLPPILFIDTDAITSKIWSNELFGKESPVIEDYIARQNFSHYLLLDVDLPWQDDIHRYRPDNRRDFFIRCKQELDSRGKSYSVVTGSGEERKQNAIALVKQLLNP